MTALDDAITELRAGRYSADPQELIARVETIVAAFQSLASSVVLPDGQIIVGNALNAPAAVPLSGDLSIINTGAATIQKIKGATVVAGGSTLAIPTFQQFFAPGAGVYARPAGCRLLRVTATAAGGGGVGVTGVAGGFVSGTAGGKTIFNLIEANGGPAGNGFLAGGASGFGVGAASDRMAGESGDAGSNGTTLPTGQRSGRGGSSTRGGAAWGTFGTGSNSGANASPNSGSGGGGAYNNGGSNAGAGGSAGETFVLYIPNPAATYNFTVGAKGTGGVSTSLGGDGGDGIINVEEFY